MKKAIFILVGAAIFGIFAAKAQQPPASSTREKTSSPSISALPVAESPIIPSSSKESTPTSIPSSTPHSTKAPTSTPTPIPKSTPALEQGCDPNYTPCIPYVSYDLDCADIDFTVQIIGTDRHKLDRDKDGYGCE